MKLKKIAIILILFAIFEVLKLKCVNANENLPSYFNLADNYNLKIEDQGSEGNCWAFASLNSLETYLMMHGYGEFDLSEMHLSYIESSDFYGTKGSKAGRVPNDPRGGNFIEAIDYMTSGYGPVLEEDFPYSERYTEDDYDKLLDVSPVAYVGSYVEFPRINKEEGYQRSPEEVEQIRKQIKKHIMNNSSISALVISTQQFYKIYNEKTASEYIPPYIYDAFDIGEEGSFEDARHIVSIIGWDDNYSRENFNEEYRPEKDGAYIVLNSWGKNYGDDGIFYVSYEDKFIEQELYGITEASTNKEDLETLIKLQLEDENLYKELKSILGNKIINHDDNELELTTTQAAIESVEKLELADLGIRNINGLEKFKNLQILDLSNNTINDFSPISNLTKIEELYLKGTGLTDISTIFPQEYENEKFFEIIDLSDNNISNLNILRKISTITELHLANTGLNNSRLEELSDIKVNTLDLSSNNNLTDVATLANLIDTNDPSEGYEKNSLSILDLSNNKNINLDTVPEGLYGLYVSNMDLTNEDLSKAVFSHIKNLSIAYNNEITNIDNLTNKDKIEILNISGNTKISIENLVNDFPNLYKLINQNSNLSSILPLLQYTEIENEVLGTIKKGIQILDLSYNNIDLAENDFEQLAALIDSRWIYDVNLSHNKVSDIINPDTGDHSFTLDLSYNNINPYFYIPDFVSKIDNQNYTGELFVDSERINYFNEIGENLSRIYKTKYSAGIKNMLEIDGAYLDIQEKSFIVTRNPGEQTTVKINGGKYKNSVITYNIKREDDSELLDILVTKNADKKIYIEGENFDKTGMKVYGLYSNQSSTEINDYEIIKGNDLKQDQGCIIIKKDDKEFYLDVANEIGEEDGLYTIVVYKEEDLETIQLEDDAFYEALCGALNNIVSKDDETNSIKIPKKQLDEVYDLVIKGDEIVSLNGIEGVFPNLSSVELHGKKIQSLEPLKDYPIYSLVIEENEILEDLDVFKDSENLVTIKLKNTKINDINNLKNLKEINIDSKTIPNYDQIADNIRDFRISENRELSEVETDNNIFILPEYLQNILNDNLPQELENQKEEINSKAEIRYLIKDEAYAGSTKKEEQELINDNEVWKIDLTKFIEDNITKNKYMKIIVEVNGEYGTVASFNYIINNDEAKVLDHLEIESELPVVFEEDEVIGKLNTPVYKVYSNGDREILENYSIDESIATKGLSTITIRYSEDGNNYRLDVNVEVIDHVHEWGEWIITKYPTKTEEGEKERTCQKNNAHKVTEIIEKLEEDKYKIIETKNSLWIRDSNNSIMLKLEVDFEKFENLIIDGNVVENEFYVTNNDLKTIEIKPEFIQTLEDGKHNYILEFEDGEASGEIKVITKTQGEENGDIEENINSEKIEENSSIENKEKKVQNGIPKTGDSIINWIILMSISIIGILGIIIISKRQK